jgi:uncharacterized protein (DUF2235 family)
MSLLYLTLRDQTTRAWHMYKKAKPPKARKWWHFWKFFKKDKSAEDPQSSRNLARAYRNVFGISKTVDVHFVGVWDTVASLGAVRLHGT